jgi:CRP/FNR family transcriptional regulator, cyclic AMP receptor protein
MDEQHLKSIAMFSSLGKDQLRRIAQSTDEVDVQAGKELLREGEYAYEFMAIEDGTAEVLRRGEHVADLGPGDVLGEIAALERGRRNASVVARSPMRLAVMTAYDMRSLAASIPEFERSLRATAGERHPVAQCA